VGGVETRSFGAAHSNAVRLSQVYPKLRTAEADRRVGLNSFNRNNLPASVGATRICAVREAAAL
jgi:hypothetical protein